MPELRIIIMVAIMAITTALIRFLPFLIWSGDKKTPKIIEKLSKLLPFAVMGMLVVYCFKDVKFSTLEGFLPAIISCILVGATYVWKRSTLISIVLGTLCYMFLVQIVF